MRVIHVVPSLESHWGGLAKIAVELAAHQSAVGVEVEIHTTRRTPGRPVFGVQDGIELREHPLSPKRRPGVDAEFLTALVESAARTPCVIHNHGIWMASHHAGILAGQRTRSPVLVSPQGMLTKWALRHRALRKTIALCLWERRWLSKVDRLHAASELEAREFSDAKMTQTHVIIPWGVDPDPELSTTTPVSNDGPRRALFISRINPKKGLPMLVAAWDRVRPRGWSLTVAGPDEDGHRSEVQRLVAERGLTGSVHFRDEVLGDEKRTLFKESEIFILPTHSENFGAVVPEAMLAGLPVLTTTGAPWSILRNEKCGWWVEPTVATVADALQTATSLSRDQLQQLGARARQAALLEYDWARIVGRFSTLYQSLLEERASARSDDGAKRH